MIYTTLLEQYRYPKIVPIEVTVLRGARRLRLAASLRRKYSDFVPKIWNILAKLGYQKYLQKIYVNIDAEAPLVSPYYQLPIVVAILEAIGMLRLRNNIYSIGRFLADYSLSYPEMKQTAGDYFPNLFTTKLENGEKLEKYLNNIHTSAEQLLTPTFSEQELFPSVIFDNGFIDVTRTEYAILKRLPDSTIHESELQISLRHKALSSSKYAFLTSSPPPNKVKLLFKKCFCEKTPCTCSKKERLLHTEQLIFLKEYGGSY